MADTPQDGWWDEVSGLLDDALDLEPHERPDWLGRLRADRPEAADRVGRLLDEHDRLARARFLEAGPLPLPSAGVRAGAYTLTSLIGHGGMGSVWLASRTDGEVEQRAAVKLLGGVVPDRAWRDRFLRERQLLASLSHPAIVRLLDAGHTEDGRPFLVMEYVDGVGIDVYAHGRPVSEVLQLFLQVCDAVSYAHHHLVIHRDLKPSNILVDQTGAPKLLDFGIARLLDTTGDLTQTMDRLLTPTFASPEQASGAAQSIATDVYSLGAVLTKLVTGRSPYEWMHPPDAGDGGALARPVPAPSSVNPEVPRDLDFILSVATRPEPDERYGSVDALSADIRRLLRSEPVEARQGDAWYRARRFTRRNRVPLGAGAVVIASMAGGMFAANRQRAVAQRRFREVRELANRFIALDAEVRALPGSIAVRQRIVSESLDYLARLGREAADDLDLLLEIASAYMQVARIQGVPVSSNLGLYADAEVSLGTADQFLGRILARRPGDRAALLTAAQVARDQMALLDYGERRSDAAPFAARAESLVIRFLRAGRPDTREADLAAHVLCGLGTYYSNVHRLDDTIRCAGLAATVAQSAGARMRYATARGVQSLALRRFGDLEAALEAAHAATMTLDALVRENDDTERVRSNLALALVREAAVLDEEGGPSLGRTAEALACLERAYDVSVELHREDPKSFSGLNRLANASREYGALLRDRDPSGALAVYDTALTELRRFGNARAHRESISLLACSALPLRRLGRPVEALARIDEAIDKLRQEGGLDGPAIQPVSEVEYALRALAEHYADTGFVEGAVDVLQRLADGLLLGAPHPETDLQDAACLSRVWQELSELLRQHGRPAEADRLDRRRASLWSVWARRYPSNAFVRRQDAASRQR